jgi:nucleotide-binding universal stress UspA family protein
MFQRILVPLDGSARAEQAVPVAARIARASGGSITLLRVVTHPIDTVAYLMQPPEATEKALSASHARAIDYLTRLANSDELAGVATAMEVTDSIPAQTILSAARLQQVDAIIMCSHGDAGFRRWALGSVAQKVARHSPVPVLVLREGTGLTTNLPPEGTRPVQVLVGLDGSYLAEAALVPAVHLSVALSAPIQGALHLAHVLPLSVLEDEGQDVHATAATERALSGAKAYLQSVEQQLREDVGAHFDLSITSSVVVATDVADALIRMAEKGDDTEGGKPFKGCDVIAMVTHGREGSELWVMGSITERVLGTTKLPLLIVRPQDMIDKEHRTQD